jgi:hypothetical protein
MSVIDMLDARDEFEKQILSNYQNILDETFRYTYKLEGKVEWMRITRFSKESNFALVTGIATLPEDYIVEDEDGAEAILDISFTIPIGILDDGSTAEEISAVAQNIGALRMIMEPDEYFELLADGDSTIKQVHDIISTYDNVNPLPVVLTPNEEIVIERTKTKLPDFLLGFDLDALNDDQLKELLLAASGHSR